jgi:hypothetical protein
MCKFATICAALARAFAFGTVAYADANYPPITPPAPIIDQPDELSFAVDGIRPATRFFWKIDGSGKGEVSTLNPVGSSVSYEPMVALISDRRYKIAPGTHKFDIGAEGYRALRASLVNIIDVKRDPKDALNLGLKCITPMGVGYTRISWREKKGSGELPLSNQQNCLTGFGKPFLADMYLTWQVLADRLHAKGHPAVSIKALPKLVAPKKLSYSVEIIYSQTTLRWEVLENGKGWIELRPGQSLPGRDRLRPNYIAPGKYDFQLDEQFHQAVLRELDPYLNGAVNPNLCTNEVTSTSLPIFSLSWTPRQGEAKKLGGGLACSGFVSAMDNIQKAFSELLQQQQIGGSKLLIGNAKK